MRSKYWSNSDFADWVRRTPKPSAATHQEWREWEQQAQQQSPIRYWLAETALHKLQNLVYWPVDQLSNFKYWINNRWVTQTHALTSRLAKGEWHEFEERTLHCLFDELVNFVEIELAHHSMVFDQDARLKFQVPWYAYGWFRFRVWRCAQAGLDYLDWASNLKYDDDWVDVDDPRYGKPTSQAVSAQEIKDLYMWWTWQRPSRPDPGQASGWDDVYNSQKDHFFDPLGEELVDRCRVLDKLAEIEQQYDQEDTDMLIRLVRVRSAMWT